MATLVRILFVLELTCCSLASQLALPSTAPATEIRLRASQLQQINDAYSADQARQTEPPTQAELEAVRLRISELRAIDATTDEGQAQLMSVIDDKNTLAYVRSAACGLLTQAEVRQLKQMDTTTSEGQVTLLQIFQDAETPAEIRLAVLEQLSSAKVRSAAVQQAVLPLIGTDIDWYLCRSAIYSLPELGVPADVAVPLLIPMLEDHRDCSVRRCGGGEISYAAAAVLGGYGAAASDAIPRLEWELDPANNKKSNPDIAQIALGQIAPDRFPFFAQNEKAIQPLIRELTSPLPGRRMRAAELLLQFREHAEPATAALEAALRDDDLHVRATAALAILTVRPHQEASGVLTQLAGSKDSADRALFVRWVGNYKLNFDDDQLLRGFLSDPDPSVRSEAAIRLAKTNRHVSEAFDATVALYNLGGYPNQVAALNALGSFPPQQLFAVQDLVAEATAEQTGVGYLARHLQTKIEFADTDSAPAK